MHPRIAERRRDIAHANLGLQLVRSIERKNAVAALVERYPEDADAIFDNPDSFISNTGVCATAADQHAVDRTLGHLSAGGRGGDSPRRFGGGDAA